MQIKDIKLIAYLIIVFQVSACGLIPVKPGKWTHPTNTQAKIKADHYQCIAESWKLYPKKMGYVSAENGHWEDARNATTECKYSEYTQKTYCTHKPATDKNWVSSDTIEGDVNAKDRIKKYSGCMTAKDSTYKCIKDNEAVDGSWCAQYRE